jgi:hypothetical protein
MKDLVGSFTWFWSDTFFVQTSKGNYLWSDPDYGGDNTLREYEGTLEKYCIDNDIPFGRDKGKHIIGEYCGPDKSNQSCPADKDPIATCSKRCRNMSYYLSTHNLWEQL